jgi:hypothetical protein
MSAVGGFFTAFAFAFALRFRFAISLTKVWNTVVHLLYIGNFPGTISVDGAEAIMLVAALHVRLVERVAK